MNGGNQDVFQIGYGLHNFAGTPPTLIVGEGGVIKWEGGVVGWTCLTIYVGLGGLQLIGGEGGEGYIRKNA